MNPEHFSQVASREVGGECSEGLVRCKRYPDLFARFADGGVCAGGIFWVATPSGKAHVSRPRIAFSGSALDDRQFDGGVVLRLGEISETAAERRRLWAGGERGGLGATP